MTVLMTLLAALCAINNVNFSLSDFNIDKNSYVNDLRSAERNQSEYCLNFIKDLEDKNNIDDFCNITVLTHGWGSSYKDWLPMYYNGNTLYENVFLDEEYSLPFRITNLHEQNTFLTGYKTSIYSFEPTLVDSTNNDIGVCIKQLVYKSYMHGFVFEEIDSLETSQIENKNIVLVYNDPNENVSFMSECLDRFERTLCIVLCKIYNAQIATLGQINMMGHSRGGLLNMLFSIKHSKLVRNLISLGTPYNGSYWANVLADIDKIRYLNNHDSSLKDTIDVYNDLLNPNNPLSYSLEFNNECKNINSFAIGFNMSPSALVFSLSDYVLKKSSFSQDNFVFDERINEETIGCLIDNLITFLKEFEVIQFVANLAEKQIDALYNRIKNLIPELLENFDFAMGNALISFSNTLLSQFPMIKAGAATLNGGAKFIKAICDSFGGNIDADYNSALFEIAYDLICSFERVLNDLMALNLNEGGKINSDICVETDSQIGGSLYNFDETEIISISPIDNSDIYNIEHCARPKNILVPHNFEVKNPLAVNRIVAFLNKNNGLNPFSLEKFDINRSIRMAVFADEENNGEKIVNMTTLSPTAYGFSDYYPYEHEIIQNNEISLNSFQNDNLFITTKRLRTGFIQSEKIVLSPNRKSAGAAYIEYRFDAPVFRVEVDLSLWSDQEEHINSNQIFMFIDNPFTMDFIKNTEIWPSASIGLSDSETNHIYQNLRYVTDGGNLEYLHYKNQVPYETYEAMKGLAEAYEFDITALPTDRNKPSRYTFSFSKPTYCFGFYTAVSRITSNYRNKGRICIGDMLIFV